MNSEVARIPKKKKKGFHTQIWGVFKALVGKIATGGVFTPPTANALRHQLCNKAIPVASSSHHG